MAKLILGFVALALSVLTLKAEGVASTVAYLGEDRAERLDVWLPPENFEAPYPAVILIHGGGWRTGGRDGYPEKTNAAVLVAAGYVVISIDYLLNEVKDGRVVKVAWPRNFQDCEAALEWTRTVGVEEFGVDPDRVAVMGLSAGATFAVLLAARHPKEIRAVVDLYGRMDMSSTRPEIFAGATDEETKANLRAASPILQLSGAMPPVFVSHGELDKIVPIAESRSLVAALKATGVAHQYVEIAGAPHGYLLKSQCADLRPQLFEFLQRNLESREVGRSDASDLGSEIR